MKRSAVNQEIKRLVFMVENTWVLHFGKNYEKLVLRSIRDKVPVISITSINGSASAIPLDRAKFLLDKYYKLTGKPVEEQGALEEKNPNPQLTSSLFTEKAMTSPDFKQRKMAANGF